MRLSEKTLNISEDLKKYMDLVRVNYFFSESE